MAVGTDRIDNGGGKKVLLPARYLMAITGSMGLAIVYGFKVNLSLAMGAMVNHTFIESQENKTSDAEKNVSVCVHEGGGGNATRIDGPFQWDKSTQGLILASYFLGYLVSQLPGGRVAELFSARWVMNGSVMLNAVAAILSPVAANLHYSVLILMRIAQGLGGGVTFPAMHVMIAKWAPPNERSILSSIVYAGTSLGTVISTALSGVLADQLGWESVFYVEGALSLIWCFGWAFLVQDSPQQQTRFITREEKELIANSLGKSQSNTENTPKPPVPVMKILMSPPFWAILIAHVCSNFGWYMLLIELPIFMSDILQFKMSENGLLTAMPYLCMWLFTMVLSKILTIMQGKKWISATVSRKIATLIASFIPMVCLICVSYVGCNRGLAVFYLTVGVTCIGGMFCGFLSNHVDIAPNFAGTLVAITNTFATIPGLIVPVFVGYVTNGNNTIEAWRIVFFVTVALYIVEILAYTIFGTAVEQSWNKIGTSTHKPEDQAAVPLKQHDKL
ncbi:sialin isoform X1 [Neodiprion pinetum]|uniref:sialin isoform X1 n=2 Tax=Neodiprion pinetum TaxID=441929 RepID=UPI001EDF09FA|nr:sialin isoform X1 [Neodiprion pinetum]